MKGVLKRSILIFKRQTEFAIYFGSRRKAVLLCDLDHLNALRRKILSTSHLCLLTLLDSLKKLGRGLLAVSLWVVAHPLPQVDTSVLESELSLPAQLGIRAGGIGREVEHVTCSPLNNLVLKLVADDLTEGVDHLEHGAAATGTQVPGSHAGLLLAKVVESCKMTLGEVDDVDVVADGSAVAGRVIFQKVSL